MSSLSPVGAGGEQAHPFTKSSKTGLGLTTDSTAWLCGICSISNQFILLNRAGKLKLSLIFYYLQENKPHNRMLLLATTNKDNTNQLQTTWVSLILGHRPAYLVPALALSIVARLLRACSTNSPQPCLDPPKPEWHDGQRQINEAGNYIRRSTAF